MHGAVQFPGTAGFRPFLGSKPHIFRIWKNRAHVRTTSRSAPATTHDVHTRAARRVMRSATPNNPSQVRTVGKKKSTKFSDGFKPEGAPVAEKQAKRRLRATQRGSRQTAGGGTGYTHKGMRSNTNRGRNAPTAVGNPCDTRKVENNNTSGINETPYLVRVSNLKVCKPIALKCGGLTKHHYVVRSNVSRRATAPAWRPKCRRQVDIVF